MVIHLTAVKLVFYGLKISPLLVSLTSWALATDKHFILVATIR